MIDNFHITNVLSLFDGMSCGQIALERVNITYDKYFSSEIDKHAIKVTQKNYPNTIQVGDITFLKGSDFPQIDLLIGGSPCQSFSNAGKKEGFNGKSGLFWEYARMLKETNPKYFFFENVNMKEEWIDIISDELNVRPINIDSRLVSAQSRNRLYWTNIPNIEQPEDKNISFSDICEDGGFAGAMRGRRVNEFGKRDDYNKDVPFIQYLESRLDNKTNCLTTVGKDNIVSNIKIGRTPIKAEHVKYRYLTRNEMERLQTVPDNYTDCVSLNQAGKMLGNGWTVDVVAHIFKNIKNYENINSL